MKLQLGIVAAVTLALLALGATAAACAPGSSSVESIFKMAQAEATPYPAPTALPQTLGKHPVYVLDVLGGRLLSELIGIDADAGKVVSTLSLRYSPDILFSPNGEKLYVLDAYFSRVTRGEARDVLSVFDAHTFAVETDDVGVPDRLRYPVFPRGERWFLISPDGKYLFIGKYGRPDVHQLRLAVLDAATFQTLAEYPFPKCEGGQLHVVNDARLVCLMGRDLYSIHGLTGERTALIQIPAGTTALTALSPQRELWYRFDPQGRITVVDLASVQPHIVVEDEKLEIPQEHTFGASDQVAISPDGARLYIGFAPTRGELFGTGQVDVVRVYSTRTWTLLGELRPTDPAQYIAISKDGRQFYATNSERRTFAIYNAFGFQELGVMRDLGISPSQILIPPQ